MSSEAGLIGGGAGNRTSKNMCVKNTAGHARCPNIPPPHTHILTIQAHTRTHTHTHTHTWLSIMIWWNWEKLEIEKKTDTMLMHRSIERFISSRIRRAIVCIVLVGWGIG